MSQILVTTKLRRYRTWLFRLVFLAHLLFSQIVSSPTSHRARREQGLGSMDVEPQVLSERTNDGDSLISRLEPDTLLNEQTWPTDEEMQGVSGPSNGPALPPTKNGTTPKAVRKVPKGTSAYQAAWIVESDDEDEVDDTDGSESEGDERYVDAEEGYDAYPEPVEMVDEEEEIDTRKGSVAFADLDLEEEGRQCVHYYDEEPAMVFRMTLYCDAQVGRLAGGPCARTRRPR
jgi:pre-rRNA-processing protein TSR1